MTELCSIRTFGTVVGNVGNDLIPPNLVEGGAMDIPALDDSSIGGHG